ncbi:MAG: imidazole glycerol phosphate synthase subunit HisH [Nitrospiraceae bacterium]|nr:imidazole glycerol phosphate synthase subunit HisH [Nitrospiraceae bacterium]
MIAIVDYGMGNLRSVEKALAKVGADARIVSSARAIEDAEAVVLPGVGAFRDCVKNLDELKLREAIIKSIRSGKPFLGICLGLQVLFTESQEFGRCNGFDVFKGKVVRFPESNVLKVPHMGWNNIKIINKAPVLKDIPDGTSFYFVHSYYVVPEDSSIIATTTGYGIEYTSMVWKDNVFATQFHPEKSQAMGLKLLNSFREFVRKG